MSKNEKRRRERCHWDAFAVVAKMSMSTADMNAHWVVIERLLWRARQAEYKLRKRAQ